jgi:SAM-dependent methyltransferase
VTDPAMPSSSTWDAIATQLAGEPRRADAVTYGPDLPVDADLRLLPDLRGRRVLDLGCGSGQNAVAMARQGAVAIGIDSSRVQISYARRLAEQSGLKVELRVGDMADLAFLRAESLDIAFSSDSLSYIEDFDRVLRQVHRVLRPNGLLVFSVIHPAQTAVAGGSAPRSYFDRSPATVRIGDQDVSYFPRTVGDISAALVRTGYRLDCVLEPEPRHVHGARSASAVRAGSPLMPAMLVMRSKKATT